MSHEVIRAVFWWGLPTGAQSVWGSSLWYSVNQTGSSMWGREVMVLLELCGVWFSRCTLGNALGPQGTGEHVVLGMNAACTLTTVLFSGPIIMFVEYWNEYYACCQWSKLDQRSLYFFVFYVSPLLFFIYLYNLDLSLLINDTLLTSFMTVARGNTKSFIG